MIVQTGCNETCFILLRCSLSYAKIQIKDYNTNFIFVKITNYLIACLHLIIYIGELDLRIWHIQISIYVYMKWRIVRQNEEKAVCERTHYGGYNIKTGVCIIAGPFHWWMTCIMHTPVYCDL